MSENHYVTLRKIPLNNMHVIPIRKTVLSKCSKTFFRLAVGSFLISLSLMLSACTQSEVISSESMTESSDNPPTTNSFEPIETETSWQITAWEQQGVAVNNLPAAEISINLDARRISGFGGCNNFGGPLTLTDEQITIGPLRSTQRSCDETIMNQETRFFQAIQSVQRVTSTGNQLILSYTVDQSENNLYFSQM